jgi:nucleotide-binding universal stress UspA family protein
VSHIRHLLVANDLTAKSLFALERAMQLKGQWKAGLTVLHVVEPGFSTSLQERRQAEALEALEHWRSCLTEAERDDVLLDVAVGEPFAVIAEKQTDLVLVGQPAKRGLRELFAGTTVERVVRFGDRPVLMVNEPPKGPYGSVLVAMDFSLGSARALQWARQIAPNVELRVVHAWESPITRFHFGDRTDQDAANERLRAHELDHIRGVVQRLMPNDAPPVYLIEDSPHSAIRSQIDIFKPDLLVMGTHSRSRLATAMVGSLALELLAEGPCDALVVRG